MKTNTINKKEIEKFSKIAEEWWDPKGKFKPLHNFNPIRISYLKENIIKSFNLQGKDKILSGIKILDIGCGGGLLSEPMSRLGAEVFGMDASEKNIEVAKLHAKKSGLNIEYFCSSPEKFKTDLKFDVILNMEIVEHVEDVDFFLESCSKLLKENGIMFVATLNKTLKSYIFAIVGAEYVLKWPPIGTHEWEKFITPRELEDMTRKSGLNMVRMTGVSFNPLLNKWQRSGDLGVNYMGVAQRPETG